jgi:hypothetical protein
MNSFTFSFVFYPLGVILLSAILSVVAIIHLTSNIQKYWWRLIWRIFLIAIFLFLVSSTIVLLFIRS